MYVRTNERIFIKKIPPFLVCLKSLILKDGVWKNAATTVRAWIGKNPSNPCCLAAPNILPRRMSSRLSPLLAECNSSLQWFRWSATFLPDPFYISDIVFRIRKVYERKISSRMVHAVTYERWPVHLNSNSLARSLARLLQGSIELESRACSTYELQFCYLIPSLWNGIWISLSMMQKRHTASLAVEI